jgi:osmoprotectant transport system permease protein
LPSLAVIAIVLPISAQVDPELGFKVYPTVVAMVVLAVPPIMVNTYSGLAGVDRDILEAGRGQGMAEAQILRRVELPLAVPVIVVGIRSAAVQVIATATLGAVFGFGGLGRYLVDGLAQISQGGTGMIFSGVILVSGLVIVTEIGFAFIQRALTPRGLKFEKSFEVE